MPPKRAAPEPSLPKDAPIDFVSETYSEITAALLIPVSITIFIVVWGVYNLTPIYAGRDQSPLILAADERETTSTSEKLGISLLNALILIAMVTVITIIMVLLYKYRCMKVIMVWFGISVAVILVFMGWIWVDLVCVRYQIPYDYVTIGIVLWNFGLVGLVSMFYYSHEKLTQAYLVAISVIMAWVLSRLPEWTTWAILIFIAIYDIIAVLSPKGPLKMLVEEAQQRDEPIPGFIYDSAPGARDLAETPPEVPAQVTSRPQRPPARRQQSSAQRTASQQQTAAPENASENVLAVSPTTQEARPRREEQPRRSNRPASAGSENQGDNDDDDDDDEEERVDPFKVAHHATHFKLGLGDFIFYSLLVARAAEYSYVSWITCMVSVLMGLVGTLLSLLFLRGRVPALPALPISIFLGAAMFFSTRFIVAPYSYWMATIGVV